MLGPTLVFLLCSVYKLVKDNLIAKTERNKSKSKINKNLWIILTISFFYLLISSLSVHKEHRFILPIVPLLLVLSCGPLVKKNKSKNLNGKMKIILFAVLFYNLVVFGLFSFYGKNHG